MALLKFGYISNNVKFNSNSIIHSVNHFHFEYTQSLLVLRI